MSRNSFQSDAWSIFQAAWACWVCGRNTADALHHIMGRGSGDSIAERSILNAAPMCNQACHLPSHGKWRTEDHARKFLKQTFIFLMGEGYELNDIDREFMVKYKRLYD